MGNAQECTTTLLKYALSISDSVSEWTTIEDIEDTPCPNSTPRAHVYAACLLGQNLSLSLCVLFLDVCMYT